MRRALPVLAVAALLAACADSSFPTDPDGPQLRPDRPPSESSCSPNSVRQAASALFGANSTEVDLAQLITLQNIGSDVATNAGFDLMAAVSALRGSTGWMETLLDAAVELSVQLIPCMDAATSGPVGAPDFVAALSDDGTYQVRGGAADPTEDVLSWDGKAGVHAPPGWLTLLGGRALFLGHPTSTFATEISGGHAYDWWRVRATIAPAVPAQFASPAVVALCANDAPEGLTDAQLRVQHLAKGDGGVILPVGSGGFLACTSIGARGTPGSLGARLVLALVELVRPAPLYASAAAAGGIGGLSTSFSPYEVVFPGVIEIAFGADPANAKVNVPIKAIGGGEITVLVTGEQDTPWQGILVRITGVINNSTNLALCNAEAETDAQGIAHFPDLTVNKAGGLYLIATTVEDTEDPDVAAYSTATTTSGHTTVKNSNVPSPC
jgi:hypothetical protein